MTESLPRPDLPPDEDLELDADGGAGRPFMLPPAPLPVAPWWAKSTPDPTPPEHLPLGDARDYAHDAAQGLGQGLGQGMGQGAVQDIIETAPPLLSEPARPLPHGTGPLPVQAPPVDVHAAPPPAPAPLPTPVEPRPRRRRRKGLWAALGVVLLLGVVAAAVFVTLPRQEKIPVYEVTAAGTAGGLRKDDGLPEATAAYPFLLAAARVGGVAHAVTAKGAYLDPSTGRQDVLFLGGKAAIGDPAAFLQRARPSTLLTAAPTVPGKGGGQVSCGTFAVLSATHLYCAWATANSFGFIASNLPAETARPAGLAGLTARMRADLEKRTS